MEHILEKTFKNNCATCKTHTYCHWYSFVLDVFHRRIERALHRVVSVFLGMEPSLNMLQKKCMKINITGKDQFYVLLVRTIMFHRSINGVSKNVDNRYFLV